ncbi:MAG TPA: MoaD/ThiS family protein [Puia sp.]|nr:MoaD/ThiS family protein [Puia sp.]
MPVKIISFGPVKDIMGDQQFEVKDVADTDQLIQVLHHQYPALAQTPYIIAVDKDIISGNTLLNGDQVVALLPPYSGG